jgi:hypothetical protein
VPPFEDTNIEQVSHFKYQGPIVNDSNGTEEEIKERIAAGNKAYYVNKAFFQSKLILKAAKLKFYKAMIGPIATYASETWVLMENITQKLLRFERRIIRKIFGPVKSPDGLWRLRNNEELANVIRKQNIVRQVTAKKVGWFGHIQRMD